MRWLKSHNQQQTEKKKTNYKLTNILAVTGIVLGLIMIVVVCLVDRQLVYGDVLNGASLKLQNLGYLFSGKPIPTITPIPTAAPVNISPIPTEEPTIAQSTQNYQSSPAIKSMPNYENYGWYQHNGQSEQYVNGQWYTTPQQNAPSQSNDSSLIQQTIQHEENANCYQTTVPICLQPVSEAEDVCTNNCLNEAHNADNQCNEDTSCLNNVNSQMTSCDSGCQSTYNSDSNKCESLCN